MNNYFNWISILILGELVAEGCQLGTAHPPGYPLFTLIVCHIYDHLN